MLKLIRALAVAALCVASTAALAGLLNRGSFTTDTDSGLDWLDVTATAGMSYGTVLDSHFALAGWRYATLDELSGLLSNFGLPPVQENFMRVDNDPSLRQAARDATDLLGNTFTPPQYADLRYGFVGFYEQPQPDQQGVPRVSAFFLYDDLRDGQGTIASNNYLFDFTVSDPVWGSLLVRNTHFMPEPSSWLLMVTALLALAVTARARSRASAPGHTGDQDTDKSRAR